MISDSPDTFMVITRDYKQLSDQLFIGLYNHILVDVQIGRCFIPHVTNTKYRLMTHTSKW